MERRLEKVVELLVDVEHHHNRQQKNEGENKCSEELTYDISVEYLEHFVPNFF